jgi:hypothetical protein
MNVGTPANLGRSNPDTGLKNDSDTKDSFILFLRYTTKYSTVLPKYIIVL